MTVDTLNPVSSSPVSQSSEPAQISGVANSQAGADTTSLSGKVWATVKKVFDGIVFYAPFAGPLTPILSSIIYLPLAGYHGLCAIKKGDEQKKQIQNALACCILAVPVLGQFYFLKACSHFAKGVTITNDNEVFVLESNDPLFCRVTRYWFEDHCRAER